MIGISEAPFAYVLLLIIPAISLYALFIDQGFQEDNLFHMGAVLQGKQYHRLITSAFLHGGIAHLAMNMITLFYFGPSVEYLYGTIGFMVIFFGAQIGAEGLTFLTKRNDLNYSALGASGAISGVMLAFCAYAPMATVYPFGIPMPAVVFAALYIAYSTFAMGGPGRVAHEAHLGGAIVGGGLGLLLPPVLPTAVAG